MTEQTCVADEQTHFGGDRVELIMPARESMLMLTRLTVAGLLANHSRDFDTQEDVKSAAAEACYCIMQQPCAYTRIGLCFELKPGQITLSVRGLEPTMQAQRLESMRRCEEVALCILESMVDSVDIQQDGGVIEGFTLIRHIA